LIRLLFRVAAEVTSSPKIGPGKVKEKCHSVDQIISKLRKADVELGKGKKVPEVCKELNAAEQTYYLWQKKVGGMQPEMVKSLEALEKTNLG